MPAITPILILAAGGSTRLGVPKQILPFNGETLLRHAARTALAANLGPVIVVLGAQSNMCATTLVDLPVTILQNPDWHLGLSRSISLGILHIRGLPASSAIIMLCDQPAITPAHLQSLAAALDETHLAAGTLYQGDLGVPAAFASEMFRHLITLTGDKGAKDLLRQRHHVCAAIPLEAAALDIDTPADAARLTP